MHLNVTPNRMKWHKPRQSTVRARGVIFQGCTYVCVQVKTYGAAHLYSIKLSLEQLAAEAVDCHGIASLYPRIRQWTAHMPAIKSHFTVQNVLKARA